MEQIIQCGQGTRTITFPKSVRWIDEEAFSDAGLLVSIVTSEKLEELQGKRIKVYDEYDYEVDRSHWEYLSPLRGSSVKRV